MIFCQINWGQGYDVIALTLINMANNLWILNISTHDNLNYNVIAPTLINLQIINMSTHNNLNYNVIVFVLYFDEFVYPV
jgi:hypothetical protein